MGHRVRPGDSRSHHRGARGILSKNARELNTRTISARPVDQLTHSPDPMDTRETKSPLKARPLRHAGQSLDEEIRDVIEDQGLSFALTGVMFVMLAALEWVRWATGAPPYPVLMSVVAAPIVSYCVWRIV